MKRIDLGAILNHRKREDKIRSIMDQVNDLEYVCITDPISEPDRGGGLVMEVLGNEEKQRIEQRRDTRKFRIQILRDAWGNPPVPGDIFKIRKERPKKTLDGKKIHGRILQRMKVSGAYEKEFVYYSEYPIDEKGCIETNFEDGGSLLYDYGVHFETNLGICGKREVTKEPCKAPNGQMLSVWYWRYKEAPPWIYETLPVLTKSEKKKRGREKENTSDYVIPSH